MAETETASGIPSVPSGIPPSGAPPPAMPPRGCQNCGASLVGPYCAQCGQHDIDYRRALRTVVVEAIDTIFNLESRFFRSLVKILTAPGNLTTEFIAGRRQSQFHPMKFYVFVSAVFFLTMSFLGKPMVDLQLTDDATDVPEVSLTEGALKPEDATGPAAKKKVDPREVGRAVQERIPTVMFFAVPLFALLLRLIYVRRDRLFVEHLVFSFHLHTWIFLVGLIAEVGAKLLAFAPGWLEGPFKIVVAVYLVWYGLVAFRRFYGQSWSRTVMKCGLAGAGYIVVLTALALGVVVVTVKWMNAQA